MTAAIGVRVIYENEEEAEHTGQILRVVHRHTVTAASDSSFLLGFLTGGATTVAIVSVTAYFLKKYFGELARPLAPNCVIYEVTVPKNAKKKRKKYISGGKLKKDLQKSFEKVEDKLRKVLGADEYDKVEPNIVESLKHIRIASVELCTQQELQEAWERFWKMQEAKATETENSVTLIEKINKAFEGKISESKMKMIIQAFEHLGVDSLEDVALLSKNDVTKQLEGELTHVELLKLVEFAKSHEMPLPPSRIRLSNSEYPNTVLTVFFDDPNKVACEYLITARDVMSAKEISVKSDANFGVLEDLQLGRRYVICVQCISNDVKSKKTFFEEPINVVRGGSSTNADSAYQSDRSGTASNRSPGHDAASVSTKPSSMRLGQDAETTEDLKSLWQTRIHEEFKKVFPSMASARMRDLLKKCTEMGMQRIEDLRFLKDPKVAEKLEGKLKIVELKILLEYVDGMYLGRFAVAGINRIGVEGTTEQKPSGVE